MALRFPNPSCSFDASKNRVDFWGYDSVIEVSFHIEAEALKKLCPQMDDAEAGLLKAFINLRKRIQAVAAEAYRKNRKVSNAYVLTARDF